MSSDGPTREVPEDQGDLCSASGLSALLKVRGVGTKKAIQLALLVRSLERLRAMPKDELRQIVGRPAADALHGRTLEPSEPPTADGGWVLSYFDDNYPEGFRRLDDPPPLIWGIGVVPRSSAVAVVGTRHPTDWSRGVAEVIARNAAERGYAVVSGLAVGIDTAAHEAALDAGGVTTAVLGNGVDAPYPASNRRLAERIIESGGTLIAEVPPGSRVDRGSLVARDRLQAALAEATVVVQSGIPGGTLHTARFTLEQKRVLVVVLPRGAVNQEDYAGSLALADPDGADPALLNAKGPLLKRLRTKRPLADSVVSSAADLDAMWDLIRARSGGPEGGNGCRNHSGTESWPSTSTEPSVTLQLSLLTEEPPPTSSG